MDLLQIVIHSYTEAISKYFLSRKIRKVYGTSSTELNCVGCPIEENIEGGSHESFDVSGEILEFSLQTRELLWGITGGLLGNYWVITGGLILFVYKGWKELCLR